MQVLCIGHSTYDITVPIETYPLENTKNRLVKKCESGGGPANNAAYLLGKWGITTSYAGVIGNDINAQKIKKELESVRVDTHLIETNYQKETSLSIVLVDKIGKRTLLNIDAEEPAMLNKCEPDFVPDIILTDGHDYLPSKTILEKYPDNISVIDASRTTPEILDLCKKVKYIVCNKDFAEAVTKKQFNYEDNNSLVAIYQELTGIYEKANIIITLEEKGILYSIDGSIKLMPAFQAEAVDTTGAGDVFHGAFVYGLAQNFDLAKTIKFAGIAAGMSTTKFGGKLSIPELSEVEAEYAKN